MPVLLFGITAVPVVLVFPGALPGICSGLITILFGPWLFRSSISWMPIARFSSRASFCVSETFSYSFAFVSVSMANS